VGEAFAGELAGWVLSPEIGIANRVPTRLGCSEGHTAEAKARAKGRLCGVRDPRHARKHFERESGEPRSAQSKELGCKGKSMDTSQ
jgi:hypothetical protein